jgi:integrase
MDLQAAGIPYMEDAGRYFDFHSLRKQFITGLVRGGVSSRVAQELARHSDIRLTMETYTDARLLDVAGALDQLPLIMPKKEQPEAERQAV